MDAIDTLLTRGVDKIYPSKEALEKVLRSGKKLKLYQGFDPTGTQLHIGHAVGFRKLRQWQDLGHQVIFLVGDGTGQAGDPTGKKKTREKFFTREELRENARNYLMQAAKIVRFDGENPIQILYNGDWLNELKLVDILGLAQQFTVQQMIERDMFQERIKKNEPINLREFMYPLLQGYDSVAMGVDLELGGSDQTFNMLAGRTLVKAYLNKEKFVMTTPLLTDAKGTKIGKTEGNVIGITDAPADLYGKIMSLSDDVIVNAFTLLTDKPLEEIKDMEKAMKKDANPMTFKKQLAFELVSQFHTPTDATKAETAFESTFQKRDATSSGSAFSISTLSNNPIAIVDLLLETKSCESKSQARRLVEQKAVDIDGTTVDMIQTNVSIKAGMHLKVGKRVFITFT